MREMTIVDLTYWKNNGLSKQNKDVCYTLLANGGGYGICVMEVAYEECLCRKESAEELRNP